jgi:hypothetical protein
MKQKFYFLAVAAIAAAAAQAGTSKNHFITDVPYYDLHPDKKVHAPGMSPSQFGALYAGTSLKRKNDIRRKQMAKR